MITARVTLTRDDSRKPAVKMFQAKGIVLPATSAPYSLTKGRASCKTQPTTSKLAKPLDNLVKANHA